MPEKYDLKEYWNRLDAALNAEANETRLICSSEEDEQSYQLQKSVLKRMLELGREILTYDKWNDFFGGERKRIGEVLNKEAEKFGKEEIPRIYGSKSLIFAEKVYLKHMQNFEDVYFHPLQVWAAKTFIGVDIEARQRNVKAQINSLKGAIESYKKEQMKVQKNSTEVKAAQPAKPASTTSITRNLSLKRDESEFVTCTVKDVCEAFAEDRRKAALSSINKTTVFVKDRQKVGLRNQAPSLKIASQSELPMPTVAVCDDKLAWEYKYTVLKYLSRIIGDDQDFNQSEKGSALLLFQRELVKGEAGAYASFNVDQMKAKIAEIRKLVSKHRDTGIVGFFKFTWARNTRSYNELNKFFDEKDNHILNGSPPGGLAP